jgi:hypothetical protein
MHGCHLFDALYDFFATAACAGGPRYARRQGLLIGRPKRDACFQCLVVPAANKRRQYGLIAAGRDAEKIDDRYSVLESLAKPSVIGRLRPDTNQSDLSHA